MHGTSLMARVTSALGGLLAIAIVTRVAWELLRPVVPTLVALLVAVVFFRLAVGRYRQW